VNASCASAPWLQWIGGHASFTIAVGPISDSAALSIVWSAALRSLVPRGVDKTVFFSVLFHRRAMQAWTLFLVSIERGISL
jgi:hypothetical protein